MRVLQLLSRVPFPLNNGGSIHSYLTARGLIKAGCTVDMLAINTPKHPTNLSELPDSFGDGGINLYTVPHNTSVNLSDAFLNLFSGDSYHISRFISDKYEEKLAGLLSENEYDIVQLEGIIMTPYIDCIRAHSKAAVVLKAHNVEHLIWERLTGQERNPLKRAYLRILTRRLKRYELSIVKKLDALISISETDLDYFKRNSRIGKCFVALPGIEEEWMRDARAITHAKRFFFIGSMDWLPNKEGLDWLVKEVWPRVLKLRTDLLLNVAGKKMETKWAKHSALTGLLVEGQVKDARKFISQNDVLLVPLFSGSGIRIKILEAMALGKAVISTSLGVEGLNCEDRKHYLLANTAEEFAIAINELANTPELASKLACESQHWVRDNFNNSKLMLELIGFYKEIRKSN